MPGPMGKQKVVVKPKNFKKTVKKLFKEYLSQYKGRLLIVLLFTIASTVFTIVGPKILGNATTEIFNGLVSKFTGGAGIDFGVIGQILLTLLVLYIISTLFSVIQPLCHCI